MEQDSSAKEQAAEINVLKKINSTVDRFLSYIDGTGAETVMNTFVALDLFEDLLGDDFEQEIGDLRDWKDDSLVRYGRAIQDIKTFRSIHIIVSPNSERKNITSFLFTSADGEKPGFTFIEHLTYLKDGKPNNRIIVSSDADITALDCINKAINTPYKVVRIVQGS